VLFFNIKEQVLEHIQRSKIQSRKRGSFSFRKCAKYATLFERKEVR
jgi:hypothetical protein